MRKWFLAVVLACLVSPSMLAKDNLNLDPWGNISSRDPVVTVLLHVDRDARNRWVDVVLSSEDYTTVSGFDVEGAEAREFFSYKLRLPPGSYTAQAFLYKMSNGKASRVTMNGPPLNIIAPG